MAKKKKEVIEEKFEENIQEAALDDVMAERFASYAKYVIQDRAIPDVRDGLKPVQRRILFAMYSSGNVHSKPTRKCAHTVGEVMGKYHPHGDTSIYFALARMSQTWKVRVPLVDFQGNNGSIDGDDPAAYRYTESRLSEVAEEMLKDIDKKTVDMQLTFDDTNFEPTVLPSRFPNLLVNGSEGIAVAVATDIPPHNLKEVCEAVIYRLGHKNVTNEDLMEIVKGPDFPTGGIVYKCDGLESIYKTGRGRIEVVAKTEIVENGDINQIIVHEIPYAVIKSDVVYEIDKLRVDKVVDGILEVRDETDKTGLRIAIDLKKDAKADVILNFLLAKTKLKTSYNANMVAIVNNRPRTLSLLQFIDAYVEHQRDVITRRSKFDLEKQRRRAHIVEGLIKAISIVDEVVAVIRKSTDKADAKRTLQAKYGFSEEQSEAIVMLQLYKLSNTDITTLVKENESLNMSIDELESVLQDEKKLDKIIVSDLKAIVAKYGTPRLTLIEDAEEEKVVIDKRDLIAKEDTMLAITRDGYIKRSSIKSYKSCDGSLPGMKDDDALVGITQANTIDYLLAFTNLGNYCFIPVHEIPENRWKEEGKHINFLVSLNADEKIVRTILVENFKEGVFVALVSRNGQIKRTALKEFEVSRYSKPMNCMRLLRNDEVVDVAITTGNSDLLAMTAKGNATYFNENELTPVGIKAAGVKAISSLKNGDAIVAFYAFEQGERGKFILVTDLGCQRVYDQSHLDVTNRLGKLQTIFKCFKSEQHLLTATKRVKKNEESSSLNVLLSNKERLKIDVTDFKPIPGDKYAKKNLEFSDDLRVMLAFKEEVYFVGADIKTFVPEVAEVTKEEPKKEEKREIKGYEQISIFDDLGD